MACRLIRRQAIIWTNGGLLLIGPSGTELSQILINIHTFSFRQMHLKMSGKWRPFWVKCLTCWFVTAYMQQFVETLLHIQQNILTVSDLVTHQRMGWLHIWNVWLSSCQICFILSEPNFHFPRPRFVMMYSLELLDCLLMTWWLINGWQRVHIWNVCLLAY